jgi:hypothetical protein
LAVTLSLDAQYVRQDACASCHLEQARGHAQSGHAKALAPGGGKGDWAFGSGTHAITWVSKAPAGHYVEHGESWFRATNQLAITPGHSDAKGVIYRIFDPGAQILRCFSCHSTGGISIDASQSIQPAELGVQCEVCHGPGQAHVEANGAKYRIDNPNRYRASAINDQCGACHRQPGADTNWRDPWNVRHQPVYLAESRCFLASNEKLSCFTCHEPHTKLATTGYDAKCQACHSQTKHKTAVPSQATCTSCHMPRVNPIPEIGFSNHWIGIYEKGNLLRPRR